MAEVDGRTGVAPTYDDFPTFTPGDTLVGASWRASDNNSGHQMGWRYTFPEAGWLSVTPLAGTALTPTPPAGASYNLDFAMYDGWIFYNHQWRIDDEVYVTDPTQSALGVAGYQWEAAHFDAGENVVVWWSAAWPFGPGGWNDIDYYAWDIRLGTAFTTERPPRPSAAPTGVLAPVTRLSGRQDGRGPLGSAPRLDTASSAHSSRSHRLGAAGSYDTSG